MTGHRGSEFGPRTDDLTVGVLLVLEKLAGELGIEPSPTRPPDHRPGEAPRVLS